MAIVSVLIHPKERKRGHWAHEVYMDSPAGPCGPWTVTGIFPSLTHTHKSGFQSVWQSFYLMVASKTWTVESLSKETVLITNLTAFWNSDEFPIIFKKRNTSHYDGMKWHRGYMITGAGPHHLNVCKCCGFATHGSRNTKAQLSLRIHSGTDGKPISTKLKNRISRWQNFDNNSS